MKWEIQSKLLKKILPKPTDRAFLCGMTGSGKTLLAQILLSEKRYVVILDTKGTIDWEGYNLHRSIETLRLDRADKLIYRPNANELQDYATIDRFFKWVYYRKHTTLYIDEVFSICYSSASIHPHLLACLTRGREMGVVVYASTQRPKSIPIVLMSEAEHNYTFLLTQENDRKRIQDNTTVNADEIRSLQKRYFIYSNVEGFKTKPLTLNLIKGNNNAATAESKASVSD